MLQVCWSPKGGSGTSVVAAALAVQAAAAGRETLLVDLAGDQSAIFGVDGGEGIGDWFAAADDVGPDALRSLEVAVGDRLRLLRTGRASVGRWSPERMAVAMALFETGPDLVVVDGGRQNGCGLPARAASVVVIRACYLGVRRAVDAAGINTAGINTAGIDTARIVLIEEPGRALSRRDIEAAVGGVDIVLPWDPAVGRAVDAGLLASRIPRSLRPLRRLLVPESTVRARA
ncbi:MAG: hypothetical protein R2707_15560 [Acidimicrobiales bacterium]